MSRIKAGLSISFMAAVVGTFVGTFVGACSKTGSPPSGFGVNITVDGSAVSTSDRMKIATGQLHVLSDKAGATIITRNVDGFQAAIAGGIVRFHYTPGADVMAGDALTFELDGLDAAGAIVASGASPKVTLAATAVATTIPLTGSSTDGSMPGDGSPGDVTTGDVNPDGKVNGLGCLTNEECGTGFCTDGVCCNEKCDDVCVSCNGTTTKGTCTPYTAGSDPEMECGAKIAVAPMPDAGATGDASGDADASDASGEAGASDAAATMSDAAASEVEQISEPDGGYMTMPKACAGTCGGGRSCNYPDSKTSCGTPFCNSRKDVASFVCDSNGGCGVALRNCTDYACDDTTGACRAKCQAHIECLTDDFCSGSDTCLSKKGNGISCGTGDECSSGNCSGPAGGSVCCNTACNGQGLTCLETGHVGQCQCTGVDCGAAACQVFYRDSDGDGYGDSAGTIAGGTAKAGCAGTTPPTGFVADNTDCDDNNINAHPGQTAYFGTARANGSFDYNCDGNGTSDFGTPEYPGVACRFCGSPGTCTTAPTLCSSGTTESYQCPQENLLLTRLSEPISLPGGAGDPVSRLVPVSPVVPVEPVEPIQPIQPISYYCCGCHNGDKTGFTTAVHCGAYAYVYTCGSCGSTGSVQGAYTQQTCR